MEFYVRDYSYFCFVACSGEEDINNFTNIDRLFVSFIWTRFVWWRADRHASTHTIIIVGKLWHIVALLFLLYTERAVTVVTPPTCIIRYYMRQHLPLRVIWIWQHSTVLCPSEMFRRNLTLCNLHVIPSNNENTVQPHKCSRGKEMLCLKHGVLKKKKKKKRNHGSSNSCVCAHVFWLKTSRRISTKFCIPYLTMLKDLGEFQFGSC